MKIIFNKEGMAMLFVLFALVIIGALYYFMMRPNKKTMDGANKSYVEEAGVGTSSYQNMLNSTKKVIKDVVATRE